MIFLKEYIKPIAGDIIFDGKIIAQHDGAAYYTIGQRHGLNITIGGGPYYVAHKEGNTIYVSKIRMTNDECRINEINWINAQNKFPLRASVKIRYRAQEIPAEILKNGEIKFAKPASAVTPGQSAVIYSKQEVLGGGIFQSSR
jgi:tRNA-specific 2-thiouridylase